MLRNGEKLTSTILSMKNITKRFHGVEALKNVSLNLQNASVHAICGENGAGKSTLMKILMGLYKPDEGKIIFKGKNIIFNDPKQALNAGIAIIEQELTPIPDMTVAENIFLGKEPTKYKYFIDYKKMNDNAAKILEKIKYYIKPNKKMKQLSIAEVQLVEIAKAISTDSEVIIMDEPTSALGNKETEILFEIIENLKKQNKAIIYISHRMKEIFTITDKITVLRDGVYIDTKNTKDISQDELVSLMISRKLEGQFIKTNTPQKKEILKINQLYKKDKHQPISIELKKGEILGIYGLIGSGRSEFLETIFGINKVYKGEIFVEGKKVNNFNSYSAIKNNFALITEDRKNTGLVLCLNIKYNTSITYLKKFINSIFISKKNETVKVKETMDLFKIKANSENQIVQNLSGGNQQKVILAKWFLTKPNILLLDEPTKGIDIAAKREIYQFMSNFANEGKAIILVSSELPEIMGMSDRIIVFKNGKIAGEIKPQNASEEILMQMAS